MPQAFKFEKTGIRNLILVSHFIFDDDRGYLYKTFEQNIFKDNGINLTPIEELQSCSKKGVLRGLHFQRNFCQDKLIRVLSGGIFDVAVDLRKGSDTFGKWEGFNLSAENHKMLYIPKGFAHGFLSLEDNTIISYLCGNRYDKESDGGIRWDDPQLAINWPLEQVEYVSLSDKDKTLPTLLEFVQQYGALISDGENS